MAQLGCRLQQGLPAGERLGDPASGRQLVPVSEGRQVGACLQVGLEAISGLLPPVCMMTLKALSACSQSCALPAAPGHTVIFLLHCHGTGLN